MDYDPVKELRVLWLLKELGRATPQEIQNLYKKRFKEEHEDIHLVLERWKDRKAAAKIGKRYKIANVPPYFISLQMDHMVNLSPDIATKDLEELEKQFQTQVKVGGRRGPQYRDYEMLEMEFECLDNILGGRPGKEDGHTVFPRAANGKLVVPRNWLRGLMRDNQRIASNMNLNEYVGWGKGEWIGDPETTTISAPLIINGRGAGLGHYEAVKAGSRFRVYVNWPFKGHEIDSIDKIKDFFKKVELAPITGFGTNSAYEGGRIQLLTIKEAEIPT